MKLLRIYSLVSSPPFLPHFPFFPSPSPKATESHCCAEGERKGGGGKGNDFFCAANNKKGTWDFNRRERLAETKLQQKRRRTISTFSVCVFFLCCRTHPHIFCAVTHVDVSLPAFFLKNQIGETEKVREPLILTLLSHKKVFFTPDLLSPHPLLHFSDLNNGNEPSNHLPHKISVKFPRFKKAHDAL